jgi:hypothetical protein
MGSRLAPRADAAGVALHGRGQVRSVGDHVVDQPEGVLEDVAHELRHGDPARLGGVAQGLVELLVDAGLDQVILALALGQRRAAAPGPAGSSRVRFHVRREL